MPGEYVEIRRARLMQRISKTATAPRLRRGRARRVPRHPHRGNSLLCRRPASLLGPAPALPNRASRVCACWNGKNSATTCAKDRRDYFQREVDPLSPRSRSTPPTRFHAFSTRPARRCPRAAPLFGRRSSALPCRAPCPVLSACPPRKANTITCFSVIRSPSTGGMWPVTKSWPTPASASRAIPTLISAGRSALLLETIRVESQSPQQNMLSASKSK